MGVIEVIRAKLDHQRKPGFGQSTDQDMLDASATLPIVLTIDILPANSDDPCNINPRAK